MTAGAPNIERFDPVNPALMREPYPTFAHRQAEPVHRGMATLAGVGGAWYAFRHDLNCPVGDGSLSGSIHWRPDFLLPTQGRVLLEIQGEAA